MSLQKRIQAARLNKNIIYKTVGDNVEITDSSGIPRIVTKTGCENVIRVIVRESYSTDIDFYRAREKFITALKYFQV